MDARSATTQIRLEADRPGLVRLGVRDGDGWRDVTPWSRLVAGESFGMAGWSVAPEGDSVGFRGTGTDGVVWQGQVRPVGETGWVCLDVTVTSDGFPINRGRPEPELVLDLGPLPPYDRGDQVWFTTVVENPTRWGATRGNDFPACYVYDPYLGAEIEMFFDMTAMAWMGPDTMARFLDYRCGWERDYAAGARARFGLIGERSSGGRFPAGRQRFVWYVLARHRPERPAGAGGAKRLPTEAEALVRLVDDCLLLPPWPEEPPAERLASWEDAAHGTARDLMDTDHCWRRDGHGEHLTGYVDGRSEAWVAALEARGGRFDGTGPCLDAATWALGPLDQLARLVPDARWDGLRERCWGFVSRELALPRCHAMSGTSDRPRPIGTWQYVYQVADAWHLCAARGEAGLAERLKAEVDDVMIPLATQCAYLFPLEFDKSTLGRTGPGHNHPVAGLFALLMLDLYEHHGDAAYLAHAKAALRTLLNLPIDDVSQEVFLMAHAVDAADRLSRLDAGGGWQEARRYFQAQLLRMMYWYDDQTTPAGAAATHRGLFQACATISYPAFLENIEVDARLAATVTTADDPLAVLRILDLGRRANLAYLPALTAVPHPDLPLGHIPLEELPMLEGAGAGFIGQEIYGAGMVFRAHLLWDALAYADRPEIQVVNASPYWGPPAGKGGHVFVVHNPTSSPQAFQIRLPIAGAGRVGVTSDLTTRHRADADGFAAELPAHAWARLQVEP